MNFSLSYSLRDLKVQPALVLAPMSGVTCSAFRSLIKELNGPAVGLMVSEFISVEALTRKVPRSLEMMRFREMERPFGVQIFGWDIGRMRDAALMVQDSGADLLDINCGCPAPKVVRKGGGCELMRQPGHLSKIINAVRAAVNLPLTLKMRSGWDHSNRNALEIAEVAQAEGVEALAVHGRTRAQLYRGDADWDCVAEIADRMAIPVLGSGDIVSAETARTRLTKSSRIAGLLIGRGALMNPLVFKEIAGSPQMAPLNHSVRQDEALAVAILDRYAALLRQDLPVKACAGKLKQLCSQMVRGFAWRKNLLRSESFLEQLEMIAALKRPFYEGDAAEYISVRLKAIENGLESGRKDDSPLNPASNGDSSAVSL